MAVSLHQPLNHQQTSQTHRHKGKRKLKMYDLIQATLTNLIEFTAIAGFAGTLAHDLIKKHRHWMAIYCPRIEPYGQAEIEAQAEPPEQTEATEDIWEAPITSSPALYWVRQPQSIKPTLALPPAKQAVVDVPKPEEIELTNLDVPSLRKLCDRHQIAWKNALGKNRHMRKAVMIFQLQQRLATKSA
jgi:hypothetical protein